MLFVELGLDRADAVAHDLVEVDVRLGQANLARRDARDIEQIFDEPGERLGIAIDGGPGFGRARGDITSGRRSMLNQPTMAFSGVRSSCDSVARN